MDILPQNNGLQAITALLARTGHAEYEQRRQLIWALIANTDPQYRDELRGISINWREGNANTASGRKGAAAEVDQFIYSCDKAKAPGIGTLFYILKELGVIPTVQEREAVRSISTESNGSYRPVSEAEQFEVDMEKVETASRSNLSNKALRDEMLSREHWASLHPMNPADHPYAVKKQIRPNNSFAYTATPSGVLAFELYDVDLKLNAYQFIHPNGTKGHQEGMRKAGLFYSACPVEDLKEAEAIIICAGNATACSIYEATGTPTVSAIDDGNIKSVAGAIAYNGWPIKRVILAGDGGTMAKLKKAARAILYWRPNIEVWIVEAGATLNYDFNDLFVAEGPEAVRGKIDSAEIYNAIDSPEPAPIQFDRSFIRPVRQLLEDNYQPKMLIKGLLPENSLASITGPTGSLKSFVSLGMALSVSTGTDFQGRKTMQAGVLMIYGEGFYGAKARVKAWLIEHDFAEPPETLFITSGPIDLLNSDEVEGIRAFILENDVRLVIIDTFARCFSSDENSSKDVGAAIQAITKNFIGAGASTLIVHHTGHGDQGRARGSSAYRAALDVEIGIEKMDGGVRLKCWKVKDTEPWPDEGLKVKVIDTGILNEDAEPVTSLVLEPTRLCKKVRLTEVESRVWEAVKALGPSFTEAQAVGVAYPLITSRNKGQSLRRLIDKVSGEQLLRYEGGLYFVEVL